MLATLTEEQKKALSDSHARTDTTFDNYTTHTQVAYLAKALIGTGDGALRDACTCGFDYMLAQQYDHGGFPQRMLGSKGIGARASRSTTV